MRASKAQVMLVDDHPILRHGMAMLINLNPDMEVIAEAGDREEALAILKAGHHPDIVLMDVSLKTVSGFEVIKSMHSLMPALPVLVCPSMTKHMPSKLCERVHWKSESELINRLSPREFIGQRRCET